MENNLEEKNSTLRDCLIVIFKRSTAIITVILTVMITAFIGVQFKTPSYESRVKMFILAKKQIDSPYYREIADYRSGETTLTQSGIVISTPVIERVAQRLRLSENSLDYEKQFCSPLKLLKKRANQGVRRDIQGSQEFAGAVNELVGSLLCGLNPGPKPAISKLFGVQVKTQRQCIWEGGINRKVCDSFLECLNHHARTIKCGGASFIAHFRPQLHARDGGIPPRGKEAESASRPLDSRHKP